MPEEAVTHDTEHYLKRELYERVRTDSALFEFLQSGSLDGIWYWDLVDPKHEWMSPGFWHTFGYDPRDMQHLASEWQDMIHPHDLQTALNNFHKHCADPDHPYDQVVRYRHRDGSWVWVRCRGLVIRDADNRPIRMLGAHTELTELKRTEEELRQAQESLRQANAELQAANDELRLRNQSLDGFVAMASHDLKTPLRGIVSAVEWLLSDLSDTIDADSLDTLELLSARAGRMSMMVDGILRFARYARAGGAPERVNTGALLDNLLVDMDLRARADVHIASAMPELYIDRAHLYQIFQNLFTNALKFCDKPRCRIDVSVTRHDEEWHVTVADNGPGIAPRHFDKIFEMFRTLQTRDDIESSGIGLALVKSLLERAHGRIWLDSELGRGTRFHFAIPNPPG